MQGEGAIVREDKNGQEYYVTRNDGGPAGHAPEPPVEQWRESLADVDTRDRTYRALLEALTLSTDHLRQLRERGLTGEAIERAGYRTLHWADAERARVVRQVMQTAGSVYLLNVPGFFKRNGSKETRLGGSPGLLIPVRDEQGHLLACLIRRDNLQDGGGRYRWLSAPPDAIGCGPGSPPHVPLNAGETPKVLRVTEGILKADVASALSGVLTLGLPGVSAWKQAVPILAKLGPERVLVAFDADARSKPHVARPLARIAEALKKEGYDIAIEVWPESAGKGIDDVLAAGLQGSIRLVEASDIADELARIAESAGVTAVTASSASSAPSDDERKSQTEMLLDLATGAEFFHSPDGLLFADLYVDDHRETWAVSSEFFKHWLSYKMYRTHGRPPNAQALNDALGVFAARARFDGAERIVHLRVAESDGCIYVDLVNDKWEIVEITSKGWRITSAPPVRFRRTRGMRPLPHPISGGSVESLRPFLNLGTQDDWILAIGWLVGALRARGPYPLAVLQGEQGSAKSTTAHVFRELVDPNTSPLRAKPADVQSLMITANNGWVVCYDNLSGLSTEVSDGLCRLATGGGFSTRELYTDSDEIILEAQRPVILTGIDTLATRADLADRSLILTLPPIPERGRRSEEEFWAAFYEAQPRIVGALLSAISGALENSGRTVLKTLPRMADFAKWVTASEHALGWASGTFMAAYNRNRGEAAAGAIDADPASVAVQKFVEHAGNWEGSATELLGRLGELVTDTIVRGRVWPRTAQQLSSRLRRAAPVLRAAGVDVDFGRTKLARTIALRRLEATEVQGDGGAATGDVEGVTANQVNSGLNDADDAGDGPPIPLEDGNRGRHREVISEDAVGRVLAHPVVAEALAVFAPPQVDVRLPDGSTWTAHRQTAAGDGGAGNLPQAESAGRRSGRGA